MNNSPDVALLRRLRAVSLLAEADAEAQAAVVDVWQLAVPIDVLRNHGGLNDADLRHLLADGLIEHRLETTRPGGRKRVFRRTGPMDPVSRTCFVLSASGLRYTARICNLLQAADNEADEKPRWDASSGRFTFRGRLIRQVAANATAQRPLLAAGEDAGWNNPIDSPFASMPLPARDHYLRRLLDQLNHGQKEAHIHFSSLNKGHQFRWSAV